MAVQREYIREHAGLIARWSRVEGPYHEGKTVGELFDMKLDEFEVPPLFRLPVKRLAGEMRDGARSSSIAHWMPAPFPKKPILTWQQQRLLALRACVELVAHLICRRRRKKVVVDKHQGRLAL